MNKYLLCTAGAMLILLLAACAPSPDVTAIEKVVTASEQASVQALDGKGSMAAVEQYFATPLESGNTDPIMVRQIAYSGAANSHLPGEVHLSNFQIDSVVLFPQYKQARVFYEINVTLLHNGVPQTDTVTQSLLMVKTQTRGWRIAAANVEDTVTGDSAFLGFLDNLAGQ